MVLNVEGLRLRRGQREILRDVAFSAEQGTITALMGASGGGKTTVLRAIAALEPFDAGVIEVGDIRLDAGAAPSKVVEELRRRVGIVFQFHFLFEHLDALQNVALAPMHVTRLPKHDAESRALALLESLAVAHRRHALPRELSGGEAQRVAIARAMAMDPQLLLMDEPTASLDPDRRSELGQILRNLAASGRTVVIATHDEEFAGEFATKTLRMREGSLSSTV